MNFFNRLRHHPTERYSFLDPRTTGIDHAYFKRYKNWVLEHVQGHRILDLGCGEGWLTSAIADRIPDSILVGIDRYDGPQVEHSRVIYLRGELPAALDKMAVVFPFDTIVATEFVEHLSETDFETLLEKIRKLWGYASLLGCTPARIRETTNPFHLREYLPSELQQLLLRYFSDVTVSLDGGDLIVFQALGSK